ncbi:MAG: GAF domain-containing protein [Bacillota bacterium]|nr:GAF domain-containing protein [Candidatus Fermentithermobacillaceae bacterium]
MGDALKALFDKASPGVINLLVICIGALIIWWIATNLTALKKSLASSTAVEKLFALQSEYDKLVERTRILERSSSLLEGMKTACSEARLLLYALLSGQTIQSLSEFLQPLTERLASGIKASSRETHRCAIWVQADDEHLRMVAGSSAFGAKFKNDVRLLIDGSIAGMCYRTGKPSLDDDAPSDPHFQHLREDRHSYSSLICAPIMLEQGHCLGVLSIDAREKGAFTQEDVEIVEAYAEMASMIMTAYLLSLSSVEPFRESLKEVAATGVSTRSKRQRTEKPS